MQPARFATFTFDAVHTAELHACAATRFLQRHARAGEILSVLLDMELQFFGHTGFEIPPRCQRTEQRTQPLTHVTPPPASCSRPMRWRKRAVSSRRPPRVDGGGQRRSKCNTSLSGCSRSAPIRQRSALDAQADTAPGTAILGEYRAHRRRSGGCATARRSRAAASTRQLLESACPACRGVVRQSCPWGRLLVCLGVYHNKGETPPLRSGFCFQRDWA